MEVLHRSATRLVLRERPWLEAIVGILFVAAGVVAAATSREHRLFGLGFVLAGAALLLLFARVVTCTFDREAGRFTRVHRGLLRTTRLLVPLGDVARVLVARSAGSRRQTYRVELRLASGKTVPLTSSYSSGRDDKQRTAAQVREVLGLPSDPADDGEAPGFLEAMSVLFGREEGASDAALAARQAIAQHEATLRQHPDDVDAYMQLAGALAMANRGGEARALLEHAHRRFGEGGSPALAAKLEPMLRQLRLALARQDAD